MLFAKERKWNSLDIKSTLTQLCGQCGPSGFEQPAARAAAQLLAPLVDEVNIDTLGNVIGLRRCGKPGAKKLLLDAHLDEVGLIVTGIEDGFLHFRSLGGVDPRILIDREVTILTEPPIFGVVSCLPPHVQKSGDSDKAEPLEQLSIDIGMNQETAEKTVPIGTPIVYRQGCYPLGENEFCGKSLDDRSCFAILLRAAELLKDKELDVDLCILGSICEEVGGRGALTAAFSTAPDWCVAVDVTFGRAPDLSSDQCPCKVHSGPAVGIGPVIPRWMSNRFIEKAKKAEIPYQVEIMSGGTGTNGDDFQTAREGISTAVLSLPLKYMHTPIEVIGLDDIEQTAQLLAAFAQDLGKEAETLC